MKVWIGGEIIAEISDEYRIARNSVEKKMNSHLADKTYEMNLDSWDCIGIIRDDDNFSEVTRFSPKKKDMDYRLRIDLNEFKNNDFFGREKLIYKMLMRSLEMISTKKNIGAGIFDLKKDAEEIGVIYSWI